MIAVFAGETKYLEAYHHFINTKDALELFFLKFLFLGPPRLGKTTVRRRLMGEIEDIESAGEALHPQPSTGTVETGHSVVVKTVSNTAAVLTESEWYALASLEDEARMLFHNLVDTISNNRGTIRSDHPIQIQTVCESTSFPSSTCTFQQVDTIRHKTISDRAIFSPSASSLQQDNVAAIFKEAMGSGYWKDVKCMFKAHLRMEDTGGQPELMDMLPALTIGPGIYLLFINLQNDLDERYQLSFCNDSGESSIPVQSNYTVLEMLFASLSSISCSNSISGKTLSENSASLEWGNILESSRSVAYIVGTHKDKVSKERIKSLNDELFKAIESTDFYKKNIVQFFSEEELIVAINNMDGGACEISQVKKILEHGMENYFKKQKVPAVWLLFSLCLRHQNKRTATLSFCYQSSEQLNMSKYETDVALWFLHHHAGVLMYFPNIAELRDLVIIDNQVIYDSVTILILRSMTFKTIGHAAALLFKKTGQFSLKDLTAVTANVSGDLIPVSKLVVMLKYLHIIAESFVPEFSSSLSPSDGNITYIMPCVLEHASQGELDSFHQDATRNVPASPLMIRYTCGFVPIGIFPALMACFIAKKSFRLISDGIKKNIFLFRFGSLRSVVTFMCRPRYIEIIMSCLTCFNSSLYEECERLRRSIESALKEVSSRMNYGGYLDYQFSFECPDHLGGTHLCVLNRNEDHPVLMDCLLCPENPNPVLLCSSHLIWYGKVGYFCSSITQLLVFFFQFTENILL